MTAIYFKLTERERQLIEQKMELAGVHNMSAYIRKMCIDGYTINLQIPELKECSRYLQFASNNINQIAKKLNSGGRYYAGELADVENCLLENKKLFGFIFEQLSKIK
jgi:Bacterial mobilisation protein (MobC).